MSTSIATSNNAIQSVDEINDSQEPVDEWIVEIEGRVENPGNSLATRPSMDSDSDSSDNEEEPSIFGKWECWNDFGASFIPENLKWHYVACMSHWFGLNIRSFLKYLQTNVDRAWSYYHGLDVQFQTAENNKRFIEHLLVSSCFLIFWMVCQPGGEYEKVINDKMNDQTSFTKGLTHKDLEKLLDFCDNNPVKIQIYMLTMNYQIPLFVLEAIYTDFSNIGNLLDTPIHKLALPCFLSYLRVSKSKVDGGTVPEGGFKHLLHIFHWSRSPDGEYMLDRTKFFCHFHIPSATELQLSQTDFVKDDDGSIGVSYSHNRRLSGILQLTPLHLYQYSSKLYEDLSIFEWRYGDFRDCWTPFMNYVACMACLVKTTADVRVLRENGVIPSTTFDDKDVLCFIQELKTFIPNHLYMPMELAILEEEVMKYHKRSVYRVIGEFKKRYCSNIWIIISVIAGILLFVLTFIQTLYSTLSYYKQ